MTVDLNKPLNQIIDAEDLFSKLFVSYDNGHFKETIQDIGAIESGKITIGDFLGAKILGEDIVSKEYIEGVSVEEMVSGLMKMGIGFPWQNSIDQAPHSTLPFLYASNLNAFKGKIDDAANYVLSTNTSINDKVFAKSANPGYFDVLKTNAGYGVDVSKIRFLSLRFMDDNTADFIFGLEGPLKHEDDSHNPELFTIFSGEDRSLISQDPVSLIYAVKDEVIKPAWASIINSVNYITKESGRNHLIKPELAEVIAQSALMNPYTLGNHDSVKIKALGKEISYSVSLPDSPHM